MEGIPIQGYYCDNDKGDRIPSVYLRCCDEDEGDDGVDNTRNNPQGVLDDNDDDDDVDNTRSNPQGVLDDGVSRVLTRGSTDARDWFRDEAAGSMECLSPQLPVFADSKLYCNHRCGVGIGLSPGRRNEDYLYLLPKHGKEKGGHYYNQTDVCLVNNHRNCSCVLDQKLILNSAMCSCEEMMIETNSGLLQTHAGHSLGGQIMERFKLRLAQFPIGLNSNEGENVHLMCFGLFSFNHGLVLIKDSIMKLQQLNSFNVYHSFIYYVIDSVSSTYYEFHIRPFSFVQSNTDFFILLRSSDISYNQHCHPCPKNIFPFLPHEYKYLCCVCLTASLYDFHTSCNNAFRDPCVPDLDSHSRDSARAKGSMINTIGKKYNKEYATNSNDLSNNSRLKNTRCPVKLTLAHNATQNCSNSLLGYAGLNTTTAKTENHSIPSSKRVSEGSKMKCSHEIVCNKKAFHASSLTSLPPPPTTTTTTSTSTNQPQRVKPFPSSNIFIVHPNSPSSSSPSSTSSTSSTSPTLPSLISSTTPSTSKSCFSKPISCSYSTSTSTSNSNSNSTSNSNILSMLIIILFVFLSKPPTAEGREPRKNIYIHAFMPKSLFHVEDYNREYTNAMINFLRDQRNRLIKHGPFMVRENITHLEHDTPSEILDAFCTNVLNGKTSAIVNFNNPLGMRRRPASSRYILNLAQHYGLPIISWDSEFTGTPQAEYEYRTLQLAPTVSHQVRAMVSVLDRYNWTHFSIITSTVAGEMEFVSSLENFVDISQNLPPSTNGVKRKRLEILSKVHIDDVKQAKQKLSQFVGGDTRVFLLHCGSSSSYGIMEAANALNLTGKDYVWILTRSCIPHAKRAPRAFPVGLLGVSFDFGKEAMKVVLRVSVKIWLTALLDMIKDRPDIRNIDIPPQLAWDTPDKQFWDYGRVLYDYMLNVTIRDEPHIVFNRNGTLKKTEISIINLQWMDGKRKSKHWIEVGRWQRYGLKMKDITWPGESPMAPTGRPKKAFLRVDTLYETPYVIYRNVSEDGTCGDHSLSCQVYVRDDNKNILRNRTVKKCCVGLSIDLLKILKVELNFDIELKEVKDGQWGGTDANGNWNGLVKSLMDKECDMVMTSLKINPDRAGAVQFSVPYLETGIKIIVALRDGAISPTAFLEPYDYASWSLILIFSVHATGSSILIFEWLSPKGLNRGLSPMQDHKFSLFRSFWLIWAMLFSTSVQTDSPRGIASRFLANIWALFALVFLASYTANLAAFMITKEEFYDLSGIKDYRLQNPYVMNPPFKYATTAFGSTEAMLKSNHMKMYKYMKRLNLPDVEAGVKALKAGDIHAFIYDSSVLEYIASRDPNCRLVTVGNRYAETGYGVGFQPDPDNPWIEKVNKVILRLQENGELDRLQKFWLAGACDTKKETGVSNRTLGILNFTSAFILLGTGILLGLVLLIGEHVYFKFGRQHLRKIDKCGCCALVSLSMGRSLRMKDTVTQAMNLVAKNRCKDPVCETHMWKLKHKLDMALLKIENLEGQLSISEEDGMTTIPKSLMDASSMYDRSQSNHRADFSAVCQQPQSHHQQQQQQQQNPYLHQHQQLPHSSSYGIPNNIGNHSNENRRRHAPTTASANTNNPYLKHNPALFEVHSIPEVMYTKDQNGDSCHIRAGGGIPEEELIDTTTTTITDSNNQSEMSKIPENNFSGNGTKYVEFPPSYSDCSTDYFHEDDGQYAPFSVLDDIDSECCSTHSTATTSLGANMTGKISPWPGLKRSPSYTSAVGGSFGSDIDNKSPNVNKSRKYDGKTYVGVSGL